MLNFKNNFEPLILLLIIAIFAFLGSYYNVQAATNKTTGIIYNELAANLIPAKLLQKR